VLNTLKVNEINNGKIKDVRTANPNKLIVPMFLIEFFILFVLCC